MSNIRPTCYFNTPSEKRMIDSRFEYIPERDHKIVSDNYDNLYLKNKYGRTAANTYLAGVSNEWRILNGKACN